MENTKNYWIEGMKMGRTKILNALRKTTFIIEMVLTLLLAVGVVFSLKDLIWYFPTIWNTPSVASYGLFKDFLGHVLLLVVGVELMLMLINHSMVAILELILFVIARKMLIYADSMLDLLMGTVSILVVFVIFRYLLPNVKLTSNREEFIFEGDDSLDKVKSETGYEVNKEYGETLRDTITNIADDKRVCIVEGLTVPIDDLEYTVTEIKDNEITKVSVTKRKAHH